jgi:hypothetical protein
MTWWKRSIFGGNGFGTMVPSLDAAASAARERLPGERIEPWEAGKRFETPALARDGTEPDAYEKGSAEELAKPRYRGLHLVRGTEGD